MAGFASRTCLILMMLAATTQLSQAVPAYVDQITGGKGSHITSNNGGGSVYIQQMPEDARPITIVKAPSRPRINYRAVSFLVQPDVNQQAELPRLAIRSYGAKGKKNFPSVESGANAVLADVSQAANLPDVGPGLMNQAAK